MSYGTKRNMAFFKMLENLFIGFTGGLLAALITYFLFRGIALWEVLLISLGLILVVVAGIIIYVRSTVKD